MNPNGLNESPRKVALEPAFVSRLTHDLRVPFAAVRSALYLLERHGTQINGPREKKWIEAASSSLNSFERLLRGVDVYLQTLTANPQAGATCDLREVVSAAVAFAHDQHPKVVPTLSWDETVAAIQPLEGSLIASALRQLLDNAAKLAPADRPPEVSVVATPVGWELAVINEGPAIPSSEEPLLFNPFFHSRSHLSEPGPGLGLAIARTAADKSGCRLVHARRGDRTHFILQFHGAH